MSNFDTAKAITTNLQTVLEAQGAKFSQKVFDSPENVPHSLLPHGEIFTDGTDFEYEHGQKPLYAEDVWRVKVLLGKRDERDRLRDQQDWIHRIRDNVTINALNIGDLAVSQLISRVTTESVEIDNESVLSSLQYTLRIRYREL